MKEFFVPLTDVAQTLADGRTVAPGERVKLTAQQEADNKGLIEDERLSPAKLVVSTEGGDQ
jgi:hypothetical protein